MTYRKRSQVFIGGDSSKAGYMPMNIFVATLSFMLYQLDANITVGVFNMTSSV